MFGRNQRLTRQIRQLKDDMNEEYTLKMRYLSRAGQPFQSAWEYTTETVNSRIEPMTRDFNQAYRRNEFYMKDMCETGQDVYNDIRYVD